MPRAHHDRGFLMPENRHERAAIILGRDSGCTNRAEPDGSAWVVGGRHLE
jgi:hypothetical protein